jgi:transcriptional antiterminator Rof (Rho-off)
VRRQGWTQELRLEEIESATEGGTEVWRLTLSMPDSNPLNALAVFSTRREYKTFTVVKSTGEVTSMKIREMSKA